MDVVKNLPRDRREAHIKLSEMFLKEGQERDFTWRMFDYEGSNCAVIRKRWEDVIVPPVNSIVKFDIEMLAEIRTKGKPRPIFDPEHRIAFLVERLFKNGVLVNPNTVKMIERRSRLSRPDQGVFFKISVFFSGEGKILDEEKCREALRVGIGNGRAYGYGLLTVETING